MLWAIRSLHNHSWSSVHIASNKLDSFLVRVGLRQHCPLSAVLFILFMDRISLPGGRRLHFGGLRSLSLFFADDVALLTSLDSLQLSVKWWEGESAPPSLRPWSLAAKSGVPFPSQGPNGNIAAVIWVPHWSVVVKRELSTKAKLLIYLVCRPYPHEFWVVTKNMRL